MVEVASDGNGSRPPRPGSGRSCRAGGRCRGRRRGRERRCGCRSRPVAAGGKAVGDGVVEIPASPAVRCRVVGEEVEVVAWTLIGGDQVSPAPVRRGVGGRRLGQDGVGTRVLQEGQVDPLWSLPCTATSRAPNWSSVPVMATAGGCRSCRCRRSRGADWEYGPDPRAPGDDDPVGGAGRRPTVMSGCGWASTPTNCRGRRRSRRPAPGRAGSGIRRAGRTRWPRSCRGVPVRDDYPAARQDGDGGFAAVGVDQVRWRQSYASLFDQTIQISCDSGPPLQSEAA